MAKIDSLFTTMAQAGASDLHLSVGQKPKVRIHGHLTDLDLPALTAEAMNEYLFEDRPDSSFQRLAATSDADVIVFGHTHKPYTKHVGGVWFVNVGSVGKPKDGDWRACYAILDTGTAPPASFVRVSYDVATVASPESSPEESTASSWPCSPPRPRRGPAR